MQVGQQVREGDVVAVLEAMKMENDITSPYAGHGEAGSREQGHVGRHERPAGGDRLTSGAWRAQLPGGQIVAVITAAVAAAMDQPVGSSCHPLRIEPAAQGWGQAPAGAGPGGPGAWGGSGWAKAGVIQAHLTWAQSGGRTR